ncbi:hypothetical protein ES703_114264 [subsurface metagenome]
MEARELALVLHKKHPDMMLADCLEMAERMAGALDEVPEESGPGVGQGPRGEGEPRPGHGPVKRGEVRRRKRSSPTHLVRMNRALVELSFPAFKVHQLLWTWRGAAAKGVLPFFTQSSLARFCATDRKLIRRAIGELTRKGWIEPGQYDCHKKNSLYKLVAIEDVPRPSQ